MRRALSDAPKGHTLKGLKLYVKLGGCHFLDRRKKCLHGRAKTEPLCRLLMRLLSNVAYVMPSGERPRSLMSSLGHIACQMTKRARFPKS